MQLHLAQHFLNLFYYWNYLAQQSGTKPVQYCLFNSANLGGILATMSWHLEDEGEGC